MRITFLNWERLTEPLLHEITAGVTAGIQPVRTSMLNFTMLCRKGVSEQPGLREQMGYRLTLLLLIYPTFLSTRAEFFDPKAMQLQTASSIFFFLPG